jgi:glutamate-1-semialdehyde 2,1-aminomutase
MLSKNRFDRNRIHSLTIREEKRFIEEHPKSNALFVKAEQHFLYGVPMNWMTKWPTPFPLFAKQAKGCTIKDVDSLEYIDFCLGDTAAFFGHSPDFLVTAVQNQLAHGIAMMLPTEDCVSVGKGLAENFGLPYWQITLSATDANRFALRLARAVTGRQNIAVFNGSYHGSLVETLVQLDGDRVMPTADSVGPEFNPAQNTRVIEFNDIAGLENALLPHDVACILVEPALTNCGLVLPSDGFHRKLREITQRTGTLLLIDETHTICAGPGGYTRAFGLNPDILTIGKPIGGGVPAAVFGFSSELTNHIYSTMRRLRTGIYAVGGTLAANALSMRALKTVLEQVMTDAVYARMFVTARAIENGVGQLIDKYHLPWNVQRLGACVAYDFDRKPPASGGEAMCGKDGELDHLLHLYFVNRGILLTPFQCMAVVSPNTTEEQAMRHTVVLEMLIKELVETISVPANSGTDPA